MLNAPPKIYYHPPSDELIETYARKVCQQLDKTQQTSEDMNSEIIWELTGFLKVVARILANHMNRNSEEKGENLDIRAEDS